MNNFFLVETILFKNTYKIAVERFFWGEGAGPRQD